MQQRLGLVRSKDYDFFSEWTGNLPSLSKQEEDSIARLKRRYDYHRADGLLLEGAINLVITAPLLELLSFIDPPFRLKSPYGITLELEDPIEIIRGFVDLLVLQERLWILTVESKRTSISVPAAFPQLLACMAANPARSLPNYGMATDGDEFVFLKLGEGNEYDVSRSFSLFPQRHELGHIAQILKRLGQIVTGQLVCLQDSFATFYSSGRQINTMELLSVPPPSGEDNL